MYSFDAKNSAIIMQGGCDNSAIIFAHNHPPRTPIYSAFGKRSVLQNQKVQINADYTT